MNYLKMNVLPLRTKCGTVLHHDAECASKFQTPLSLSAGGGSGMRRLRRSCCFGLNLLIWLCACTPVIKTALYRRRVRCSKKQVGGAQASERNQKRQGANAQSAALSSANQMQRNTGFVLKYGICDQHIYKS